MQDWYDSLYFVLLQDDRHLFRKANKKKGHFNANIPNQVSILSTFYEQLFI